MAQVAWIFDLNKCNGCPTCVTNCWALWRNADGEREIFYCWIETKPGEGHPRGWEKKGGGFRDGNLVFGELPSDEEIHTWIEYEWKVNEKGEVEVVNGRPVINPKRRAKWTMHWEEDVGGGEWPNSWHFYLPRLCNNCSNPACLPACKEGAIVKDEKFGVVLIDEEKCNGCKDCIKTCPYKIPWYNAKMNIVQKCIACYPRIEQRVAPACARSCPARAVHFGYLDDENSSVYKLVKKWKVALPLHPEFGTQPNVYYIPPLSSPKYDGEGRLTNEPRIPLDYLKTLFGDGVEDALSTIREEREKMRRGERSELMEILIGFRWPDDFFKPFVKHPDEVFVRG
ncbi:4Fe-4S dicluster domain-containing protein [Archaeoglobus sp. JdFR-39]|jgi:ethylbenzene hydroxylase subunit beta/complex iron-sulfur molybdoenzyme family reductase subunit beta|uniref:4Fe-4S dicluster domain-containing protein n=3 Tax=unclassified Archaeoglobus TaxID=2643606 RepID=UPI0025BAC48D|nr:4Fe-4S dicluster domain-containing protein [Archaeoglobus sp. JdFR-39]